LWAIRRKCVGGCEVTLVPDKIAPSEDGDFHSSPTSQFSSAPSLYFIS
jgi:hypothetical protein